MTRNNTNPRSPHDPTGGPLLFAGLLSVLGCTGREPMNELSAHGLTLNKARNTAFVVQTSDHQERLFGDEDLIEVIPALQRLPQIKRLQLTGSSVTDVSIARLKNLRHIEEIEVIDTSVTRHGLLPLQETPNLHFLLVDGERLFEADVKAVQDALPDVQVLVKKRLGPLYPVTNRPSKFARIPP
jgi:hypothetical protein